MIKRAKDFFSSEGRTARFIFTILVVVAFSLVFGPTIYAQFVRTSGPVGFSYGYGYGVNYGYGYGYLNGEVRTSNEDYGFLGVDGKATSVSVSTTATTMTVNYSTNYLAKNKIQYGLTTAMSSTSSESAFQTGANSITVTGLTCGVTYYYRVVSTDAGNGVWYSTPTFSITATANCTSSGSVGGGGGGGAYNPTATTTPAPTIGLPYPNPTTPDQIKANIVYLQTKLLALLQQLLALLQQAMH